MQFVMYDVFQDIHITIRIKIHQQQLPSLKETCFVRNLKQVYLFVFIKKIEFLL